MPDCPRMMHKLTILWAILASGVIALTPAFALASTLVLTCVGTPTTNAITTNVFVDLSAQTVKYRMVDNANPQSAKADVEKDTITWFEPDMTYFYILDRKTNRMILTMEQNPAPGAENMHIPFVDHVYDCHPSH
jgi:hypothetical protein